MQDMLVKQLLGRFRAHKLSVRSILTSELSMSAKFDVEEYVKREMVSKLAQGIVYGGEHNYLTWTCGEDSPELFGKPIRVETYCLSEAKFHELIKAAFNAGVESAWRKEDEKY